MVNQFPLAFYRMGPVWVELLDLGLQPVSFLLSPKLLTSLLARRFPALGTLLSRSSAMSLQLLIRTSTMLTLTTQSSLQVVSWVEEFGLRLQGGQLRLRVILFHLVNKFLASRIESSVHAAVPWEGDRVVMVQVNEDLCEELRALGCPIDNCDEPLPALAAEAPESLAADAPPDGRDAGSPVEVSVEGDSNDDSEEKVPERVVKLTDQAMKLEQRLLRFAKNPICDVCNQAGMLSRRVRRKPRDREEEPDPFEVSEFGNSPAADDIHVFKSPDESDALDKSHVVLCLRDKFTGLFAAFPGTDRSTSSIVNVLRKFVGHGVCSKPVTLVSDAADDFVAAAVEMGCVPPASIPNRFPRNAQLGREIRTFQEGSRASFLRAGFSMRPELWPVACR